MNLTASQLMFRSASRLTRSWCVWCALAGEVFAINDECTHADVPLSEGEVDDCAIECWLHGSRFDLRTGAVLNPPATRPVATFAVRVVDGHVQVSLP